MRDRRFELKLFLLVIAGTMLLSGCIPSHSDTLIFGTQTKLAVDLSINSTTNVPSMTVGYTRQEGVWMPLYVNSRDSRFSSFSSGKVFRNFTSGVSGLKYVGNEENNRDTYSVLASFGANISGGSNSSGVGIAQYFATGIAARKLADKGGEKLVSIQSQKFEFPGIISQEDAMKNAQVVPELFKKIDSLKKETAILLATNPPVSTADIDSAIAAMDPDNLKSKDEVVAKSIIKRRISLNGTAGGKASDYLDRWDKALAAYSGNTP